MELLFLVLLGHGARAETCTSRVEPTDRHTKHHSGIRALLLQHVNIPYCQQKISTVVTVAMPRVLHGIRVCQDLQMHSLPIGVLAAYERRQAKHKRHKRNIRRWYVGEPGE